MMHIFDPILDKVNPFKDYMSTMFEKRQSYLLCSHEEYDKILPYDLLRSQIFYPTRVDVH